MARTDCTSVLRCGFSRPREAALLEERAAWVVPTDMRSHPIQAARAHPRKEKTAINRPTMATLAEPWEFSSPGQLSLRLYPIARTDTTPFGRSSRSFFRRRSRPRFPARTLAQPESKTRTQDGIWLVIGGPIQGCRAVRAPERCALAATRLPRHQNVGRYGVVGGPDGPSDARRSRHRASDIRGPARQEGACGRAFPGIVPHRPLPGVLTGGKPVPHPLSE